MQTHDGSGGGAPSAYEAVPAAAPAVWRQDLAGTSERSHFDRLLVRKDMVIREQEHAIRLLLLQLEDISTNFQRAGALQGTLGMNFYF